MQPDAPVLQVEPTDHCNLRCRMCAPHHEGWETVHGVPKGYLDPALWERVVDGFVAEGVRFDHVIFQWLGDPSLHPQLHRLVGTAARRLAGQVGYLRVDTNGILLQGDRMDALVDAVGPGAGPDAPPLLVVVTLDAATPPVYADVKGRDALVRVRRNVRRLLRRRREAGARVNLQLQFVVQPGNAHEVGPFLQYWKDLLACQGGPGPDGAAFHDEIMFKRLSVGGGAAGQAQADALYEQAIAAAGVRPGRDGPVTVHLWERRPWQEDDGHVDQARTACPGLWLTPVIRQDGHLVMCCADLHSQLDLGSLAHASFTELWHGERATRERLAHLAGRFEGPCAGCGGINWYETTPEMAAAARARGAELGLAPAPVAGGPR